MSILFLLKKLLKKGYKMKFYDKNNIEVKAGDVIDLHQTVNGESKFLIESLDPLDIRYRYDANRKYEYDKVDLLSPSMLTGETEYEIIEHRVYPVYPKPHTHRHWFLYAKGHYEESLDIVEDLKKIQGNWSGIYPEHLTKLDVVRMLMIIVEPIISQKIEGNDLISFISDLHPNEIWKCGYPKEVGYDYHLALIYKCLSVLRYTPRSYWVELGEPDYTILNKKGTFKKVKAFFGNACRAYVKRNEEEV